MRLFWLRASRLLLPCLLSTAPAAAQDVSPPEPSAPPPEVHEHVAVTATALTPTRETSGTAWLPSVTPMYGIHRPWRGWDLRLNGAASLQAIYEPGYRHRTGGAATRQLALTNWGMAMVRREVRGGRFGVRTMLSAESWTLPSCGSLNFLATGEVCQGDTVHDRQQSHDLFMELAVDYDRELRGVWRWQLYAGLAGEPALGPPGYPHRAPAMANPIGPVTHHWLDSTQITFGLITAGVHNQRWKVEASVFNGREPDERRVDLDLGAFDSASARLSFLPTERLAVQVSAGRLRDARTDFIQPQDVAIRITTSGSYHRPVGTNGIWATTAAYGMEHGHEFIPTGVLDVTTFVSLVESSITVSGRHTVFGRGEFLEMPAHHLHAHEYAMAVFPVGKLQIGYVRHLGVVKGVVPGIGGSFSISLVSRELAPRYSGAAPSLAIFLNLLPAQHQM